MIERGNLTYHLALRRRIQSEFQINSFFLACHIHSTYIVGECNILRFLSLFFWFFFNFYSLTISN